MLEISIQELQKRSRAFRTVASRALSTSFQEAPSNLCRLLDHIKADELISSFIAERLRETYAIEDIVKDRDWRFPFDVPTRADEEISFVYQLLSGLADGRISYQSVCYGYGSGRSFDAHATAFNRSVVNPFVNHITSYFEDLMIEARGEEGGRVVINVSGGQGVQFNLATEQGTVVATNSSTFVAEERRELLSLLDDLIKRVETLELPDEQSSELTETTDAIRQEVRADKPRRGLLRAMGVGLLDLIRHPSIVVAGVDGVAKITDDIEKINHLIRSIV